MFEIKEHTLMAHIMSLNQEKTSLLLTQSSLLGGKQRNSSPAS